MIQSQRIKAAICLKKDGYQKSTEVDKKPGLIISKNILESSLEDSRHLFAMSTKDRAIIDRTCLTEFMVHKGFTIDQ